MLSIRLQRSGLLRAGLVVLSGNMGVAIIQGAYFFILARWLGAGQLGVFVSALAVASILGTFGSLGAGNLMVVRASRDQSLLNESLGTTLAYVGITTIILGTAGLLFGHFTGFSLNVILPLLMAELVGTRLVEISAQAYQAIDWLTWNAWSFVLMASLRLLALIILGSLTAFDAELWSLVYGATSLSGGVVAIAVAFKKLGLPKFSLLSILRTWRSSLPFSLGMAARTIYVDADKIFIQKFVGAEAAGAFGVAARIINLAFTPSLSLVYAANTRLFRAGTSGAQSVWGQTRKLLAITTVYGALAIGVILTLSPIVPILIGASYREVPVMLLSLSPLLILQGVHYAVGDSLMGLNRQGLRSAIQLSAAVVSIALNFILVPALGWVGAVVSTLLIAALLSTANLAAFAGLRRRERLINTEMEATHHG